MANQFDWLVSVGIWVGMFRLTFYDYISILLMIKIADVVNVSFDLALFKLLQPISNPNPIKTWKSNETLSNK